MGAQDECQIQDFFFKNCENTGKILKIHVQAITLLTLTLIFLGPHKKFSLLLLRMTNYIYSPWEKN